MRCDVRRAQPVSSASSCPEQTLLSQTSSKKNQRIHRRCKRQHPAHKTRERGGGRWPERRTDARQTHHSRNSPAAAAAAGCSLLPAICFLVLPLVCRYQDARRCGVALRNKLHVTRHTLQVTRHTSHVTRHTSHVKRRYTWHITHPSHTQPPPS